MPSSKDRATSTDLICLQCGNVTSIFRRNCKGKKLGHIKPLWCYKCKDVTNHYEVKDIDKFLLKYLYNECISIDRKEALQILVKEDESYERDGIYRKIRRKR